MGNKKVVFKFFTIVQYRQEEEYLSSMHEKGWKLTKITLPGFYHFEKCEPRKVAYRLDYTQERVKTDYIQMFSDCGWDYLFDFVGYSYFCKESDSDQEREEIFCDDSSRLDLMRRVFKGRIIPLIILFAGVILPQLFANILGYGGGGSEIQDILSITFLILAVFYLFLFSVTAYQFYQYEKRVSPEDTGVKYKYCGISIFIFLIIIGIGTAFYFSRRSVYSVSQGADGFTIEAEQLNERVMMEYDLTEGDIIVFRYDYGGGAIWISIGEEDREPILYGNSYSGMEDFEVMVPEDGRYKIECSGRRAKGVISFVIEETENPPHL